MRRHRAVRGFTLIEVLLALFILAMVLGVVHAIFHGALQLRNQADQAFEESIPLQHAVSLIKRDFENLAIPGGTPSSRAGPAASADVSTATGASSLTAPGSKLSRSPFTGLAASLTCRPMEASSPHTESGFTPSTSGVTTTDHSPDPPSGK